MRLVEVVVVVGALVAEVIDWHRRHRGASSSWNRMPWNDVVIVVTYDGNNHLQTLLQLQQSIADYVDVPRTWSWPVTSVVQHQ